MTSEALIGLWDLKYSTLASSGLSEVPVYKYTLQQLHFHLIIDSRFAGALCLCFGGFPPSVIKAYYTACLCYC